jgi:hypothetical protein
MVQTKPNIQEYLESGQGLCFRNDGAHMLLILNIVFLPNLHVNPCTNDNYLFVCPFFANALYAVSHLRIIITPFIWY